MTEIDPWEVAKAAAEDHYLPRMDGTVAPDHVQQAFIDGFAGALERLPSRDEIGVKLKTDTRLCYPDGAPVDWSKLGDAALALIREAYESR